jgi:RHS repeat-associated protein
VDPTGLTHLGAREYDPGLGKFLSVDPLQDVADPQQWNAYAYSNGNPVTFSDPSGMVLCGDDACTITATPTNDGGELIHNRERSTPRASRS